MKKIFIISLVIAAFALSNCELNVKEAKAQDPKIACGKTCLQKKIIYMDEMKYAVFYSTGSRHTIYEPVTVYVVNLTKDKLEVELLKKQLK